MNASNNDYWVAQLEDPLNLHNSALVRPLEELLHYKCGALRGELDSSTPRAIGGFWSRVCLG